ncbi:MAG: beta-N-acetylglucosaminidase domain-containing protein [Selenomonadaceae bacterium]|nr:beta-N-acetylglucosaminidase domain-containing protein [Selenomonadaceae bacterium]
MKILKYAALILLLTLTAQTKTFAAPIPLRGVVEGFYGTAWTFSERADMMNFFRQHNLNAYIYAPKDDPFHREKWREPYPAEKISELKNLVDEAKKHGVKFIFAVSPGLDLNYKGKKSEDDFNSLMQKFEAMYQIGVRDFAVFFDDLKDKNGNHHEDGEEHAKFLNRVQTELQAKHKDIFPLITVPTEYYRLDMMKGNKVKSYTENLAKNLNKKIIVLYTGDGVVCDGITQESLATVNKIFGREIGIWWNYPVNDYSVTNDGKRNAKLALGAVEKLPAANVQAIFFNPMTQAEMSKIALATGAEYANSPTNYDAEKSWDKTLSEQFGELAEDMKIFAEHSRHMENSWAKVGADDGKRFNTAAYLVLNGLKNNHEVDFAPLEKIIDEMENSASNLLEKLPQNILKECRPQLEQFQRISQADKIALESLKSGELNPQLKILREEIQKNEPTAILSEKSALKFIDDVINFFANKK